MAVPRFRSSSRYGHFYAGRVKSLRFLVEKWNDVAGTWDPVDLTAYSSVRFQVFATDAASSLLWNIVLTVLSSSQYLVNGVACRAEGQVTFAAAADAVRCQLVLVTGSASEVVDKQWEAAVYTGGPTS